MHALSQVHVHSNPTCTGDAGGHYYTGTVTTDPWTDVAYTATAGVASGSATVETGGTSSEINGLAFVVHAYDGSRIACAILAGGTLMADGFVPYYTYTGALDVSGTVGPMTTSGTTQTFSYNLAGLDPACSAGAGTAANSCGVHIHSNPTCTGDAGGHFYTGTVTTDPWASVSYSAPDGDGTASASVTVETGGTSSEINGLAFVVHAYDGSRIACAILGAVSEVTLTATGFVKYYSYTGNIALGGVVGPMTTSGTTQTFYYSLTGVDPACSSGAGTAANSCGIHIHSGATCTDNAGGHFYTGAVTADPWASIAYTMTGDEGASGSVTVDTGATAWFLVGLAFIVHAYDGSRVACGILGTGGGDATLMADGFVPYFSYTGALRPVGTVGPMTTSGTTQTFSYSFSGLDPACSAGAGTAANSCGVHIHSNPTCTGDAGGHFYTGTVTTDPWASVSYTTPDGFASETVTVETGGMSSEINGLAFVVHAYDGSRIACAILGAKHASMIPPPTSGTSPGTSPPAPPPMLRLPPPPISPPASVRSRMNTLIGAIVMLGIAVGLSLLAKATLKKKGVEVAVTKKGLTMSRTAAAAEILKEDGETVQVTIEEEPKKKPAPKPKPKPKAPPPEDEEAADSAGEVEVAPAPKKKAPPKPKPKPKPKAPPPEEEDEED